MHPALLHRLNNLLTAALGGLQINRPDITLQALESLKTELRKLQSQSTREKESAGA